MKIIAPPLQGEYPTYAELYMKLVPKDGQLLQHLKANFGKVKLQTNA